MIYAIIATCLISYILGSLNFAIICSRLFRGEDVREHGSGGAGLTNYARNYGAGKSFIIVIIGDMGKCLLAVWLTRYLFRDSLVNDVNVAELMKYLAGLFVLIGHIYPVFFGFKGGKGVLSTGALMLAFDWRVFLIAVSVFLLVSIATRFVSLGSLIGVFTLIPLVFIFHRTDSLVWVYTLSTGLIWVVVLIAHRANIKRLFNGTETKFSLGTKKRPKKGE